MTYTVVVERTTTGWSAFLPEVPGCIATGSTRSEVEDSIRVALELHFEGMREDGERVPDPDAYAIAIEDAA